MNRYLQKSSPWTKVPARMAPTFEVKLYCFFAAALAFAVPSASTAAPRDLLGRAPNVVFILSDDQRPDTIRALGNKHIKTPNLDRLVHNGFTFTHAFCMGSTVGAV